MVGKRAIFLLVSRIKRQIPINSRRCFGSRKEVSMLRYGTGLFHALQTVTVKTSTNVCGELAIIVKEDFLSQSLW